VFPLGATYLKAIATDACGNTIEKDWSVNISTCERFCTLTQGFYGNAEKGNAWKADLLTTLMGMLNGKLVVGSGNTLTFTDWTCITKNLPCGGPTKSLTQSHTFDKASSCTAPDWLQNPKSPKGRIWNTFVGQVVTLTLNLQYNKYLMASDDSVADLSNWDLPASFCTGRGTFEIPAPLVGLTVQQLLDLANQGLGGKTLPSGVDLNMLNSAVSSINEAFDECSSLCEVLPD
jgi:subtilisin family serine protease